MARSPPSSIDSARSAASSGSRRATQAAHNRLPEILGEAHFGQTRLRLDRDSTRGVSSCKLGVGGFWLLTVFLLRL